MAQCLVTDMGALSVPPATSQGGDFQNSKQKSNDDQQFVEASGSIAETCPVYVDLSLWMWINVDLTLD